MTTQAAAAASVPHTAPRRASGPGRMALQCRTHQSHAMRHQCFTRARKDRRNSSGRAAVVSDISDPTTSPLRPGAPSTRATDAINRFRQQLYGFEDSLYLNKLFLMANICNRRQLFRAAAAGAALMSRAQSAPQKKMRLGVITGIAADPEPVIKHVHDHGFPTCQLSFGALDDGTAAMLRDPL